MTEQPVIQTRSPGEQAPAERTPGGAADTPLHFYYSLRSPYAWLAFERFEAELGSLPVPLSLTPMFPNLENFPNDPARFPQKLRYMGLDVARLAREYGLKVAKPHGVPCQKYSRQRTG